MGSNNLYLSYYKMNVMQAAEVVVVLESLAVELESMLNKLLQGVPEVDISSRNEVRGWFFFFSAFIVGARCVIENHIKVPAELLLLLLWWLVSSGLHHCRPGDTS